VPFTYDIPPNSGSLRQGEILGDVWEHRPLYPPVEIPREPLEVTSVYHPLMVVMTADCDLYGDFDARFPDQHAQEQYQSAVEDENHPKHLPHTLLCDAYKEEQIRLRIGGSDLWRRIKQNQDERYHHFGPATIGNPPVDKLPDLYLDFKKVLALPTRSLYEGIRTQGVKRLATVPPIYIHNLMHRFYGFQSRVGLPD